MELGGLALSYAAGALSTLSPCVLPLLPIVLASAVQQHILGPLALTVGLAVSFAAMGIFAATLGLALGLHSGVLRALGAVLMLALGIVLLVPALYARLTQGASLLTGWANRLLERMPSNGAGGQLLLGLVLGVVWAPCAGPTLGAAVGLAAQRETMLQAAVLMAVFGFGAATPLLALAYGSRTVLASRRDRLRRLSIVAKPVMGVAVSTVGLAILVGLDKRVETYLTNAMPDWLLHLTTQL